MEVTEDAEPGSSNLQVEATDLDSEISGDIEYSIISEAEEYFGIYSNRSLYSRRGLDREDKPSFSFILKTTVEVREVDTPPRPQWFSVCLT